MFDLFRKNILSMGEYVPPLEGRSEKDAQGRGYLLLDFNERTIPPPKRIRDLGRSYEENVYPWYKGVDEIIAGYAGVKMGQTYIVNGSDQGIDITARGNVGEWDVDFIPMDSVKKLDIVLPPESKLALIYRQKVVFPTPSFAMFKQSSDLQAAQIVSPRYKEPNFSYPLKEVLDDIDKHTALVIACNPNNPTGTVIDVNDLDKVAKKCKNSGRMGGTAFMIDEAYHEFDKKITAKDLIDLYDNVFISRSFSKVLGIAALRAGYVLSQEQNIAQLRKIRGPYDVNMEASSIVRTLKYKDTVKEMMSYIKEVMEEAKPRTEEFFRERRIKFYESAANFLLVDSSPFSSLEIYEFLKSCESPEYRGILVRPRLDPENTFRVTIGTNENMDYFMTAFDKFLESKGR